MKRKRLEKIDNELFKSINAEEIKLVNGGFTRHGTAHPTSPPPANIASVGGDGSVDVGLDF